MLMVGHSQTNFIWIWSGNLLITWSCSTNLSEEDIGLQTFLYSKHRNISSKPHHRSFSVYIIKINKSVISAIFFCWFSLVFFEDDFKSLNSHNPQSTTLRDSKQTGCPKSQTNKRTCKNFCYCAQEMFQAGNRWWVRWCWSKLTRN